MNPLRVHEHSETLRRTELRNKEKDSLIRSHSAPSGFSSARLRFSQDNEAKRTDLFKQSDGVQHLLACVTDLNHKWLGARLQRTGAQQVRELLQVMSQLETVQTS